MKRIIVSALMIFLTTSSLAYAQLDGIKAGVSPTVPGIAPTTAKSSETKSTSTSKSNTSSATQNVVDPNSFLQGMQSILQSQNFANNNPSLIGGKTEEEKKKEAAAARGNINDRNSPAYKANKLAKEAQKQWINDAEKIRAEDTNILNDQSAPPNLEVLQRVKEFGDHVSNATTIIDADLSGKDISLDMRRDAQKEAAISYGARGGLAKRNFEIMEQMKGFDPVLDRVFDFRALLIKAPSGMQIEPPIVKESVDALKITDNGNEAAVAQAVFDINKKAKIVSAPRDWRQYLIQTWGDVPPPPRVLWPQNPTEQANWNSWVAQGWKAGVRQAEEIFEMNVNRLSADYNGMVRYRMLLAQGMISEPYALHEDRGVVKDKNQMRVGDRALRITGPSEFLAGEELWKPADR